MSSLAATHPKGIPIAAAALDGRIDFSDAHSRLKWPEIRRFAFGRLYQMEDERRLWLFGFGAVVQEGAERISEDLQGIIEDAAQRKILHETMETYFVAEDPQQPVGSPRVGWDQVMLPERSPELISAVALLLAQSAALERYEIRANVLLDEALTLTRALAESGRPDRHNRKLSRQVGRILSDRLELAHWFYLVDRPEETWENAKVSSLYDALFNNLELKDRHHAMLHKLEAVETATEIIIDIWQGKQSNFLEWAIVILIVVEIVMVLLGHRV